MDAEPSKYVTQTTFVEQGPLRIAGLKRRYSNQSSAAIPLQR